VAGAIATAQDETAADVLLGIGGSPEAVIAAAALKCMGGEIQCKLWPRNEEERQSGVDEGLDLDQVMDTATLVASDNVFFAATGVTGGEYLKAVEFRRDDHVVTHSVIMRSKTGSIRYMEATHNIARLGEISAQTLD
jgi:fructose-1,6-bisphosphatase II